MFLDEARLASNIVHPNVAQIFELGEDDGTLFIVMEWVDGISLGNLRRALEQQGRPLGCACTLRILADVCSGLHAVHTAEDDEGRPLGIVHRDLSPQNIMVSVQGIAKIIDFGVAKGNLRVAESTTVGSVKGKIAYMSPEQLHHAPLDGRSDIWSLGAVLYWSLTGAPPHLCDTEAAMLYRIANGQPPPPLPPNVPEPLQAVVDKAMAFRPHDRFHSALEMRQALEDVLLALPSPPDEHGTASLVREVVGRGPLTLLVASNDIDPNEPTATEVPSITEDLPGSTDSRADTRPPASIRKVLLVAAAMTLAFAIAAFGYLGLRSAPLSDDPLPTASASAATVPHSPPPVSALPDTVASTAPANADAGVPSQIPAGKRPGTNGAPPAGTRSTHSTPGPRIIDDGF